MNYEAVYGLLARGWHAAEDVVVDAYLWALRD